MSRRLMDAFRAEGIDARMLVVDKQTDSPYVEVAAGGVKKMTPFIMERLEILKAIDWHRSRLFTFDTASYGLPLWEHPLVKEADAVLLNWVNQGMLSLVGVKRILRMGKPVVWTMHDMWCMTGVCHHSGTCDRFTDPRTPCTYCPELASAAGENASKKCHGLAYFTALRKAALYANREKIRFVAVSSWLAGKARMSDLLSRQHVSVIPNVFPLPAQSSLSRRAKGKDDKVIILFGAARLDDRIKGLDVLREAISVLSNDNPDIRERLELVTFGGVKNPESLRDFGIAHRHLGVIKGEENLRKVYEEGDILVSASSYETLPGTLVEAQAYGCIPVSFGNGGQSDIVTHKVTGYIADLGTDAILADLPPEERATKVRQAASNLAKGMEWAVKILGDAEAYARMLSDMRTEVARRFSPRKIAGEYLELLKWNPSKK